MHDHEADILLGNLSSTGWGGRGVSEPTRPGREQPTLRAANCNFRLPDLTQHKDLAFEAKVKECWSKTFLGSKSVGVLLQNKLFGARRLKSVGVLLQTKRCTKLAVPGDVAKLEIAAGPAGDARFAPQPDRLRGGGGSGSQPVEDRLGRIKSQLRRMSACPKESLPSRTRSTKAHTKHKRRSTTPCVA